MQNVVATVIKTKNLNNLWKLAKNIFDNYFFLKLFQSNSWSYMGYNLSYRIGLILMWYLLLQSIPGC